MIVLALVLSACSTPEAPKPAAAPPPAAPAPAPAPAPMPADMPGMDMSKPAGESKEEADEGGAPTVIPADYAGIIGAMKEKQAAIKGLLDAGKLKDVHPVAKQLMDLATALPGKATALPAASKGTATLKSLDIKEQADAMHDKADEGDAAGAKAAFEKVSADIDALAALSK